MQESLSGQIERVTFHNPENGFVVLKVRALGHEGLVTVLGRVTMVAPGETLDASGRWIVDPNHGRQFRAERIDTVAPDSPRGIERYLGSGAVRGIGPSLAARIVRLFRHRTLEVLDQRPGDLLEIRGIGAKRLTAIRQSWQERRAVREISLFLHRHGIGAARAVRIHRVYGDQALTILRTDPYRLAADIRGIGFATADALARSAGLPTDSPARLRAGLRHVLLGIANEGHCAFPQTGVLERTRTLLVGGESEAGLGDNTETAENENAERERATEPTAALREALESEVRSESVVREPGEFEGDDPWLFPATLHHCEEGLADCLRRLVREGVDKPGPADVEAELAKVERRLRVRLAEGQRSAIREVCRSPVVIVTGGPGVGKTTLVRALLAVLAGEGLRCVLAAPTGRAAKRLSETTGRTASTIHRLLEFDPATGGFLRGERLPAPGELFVLDEASMLDVPLAYQFFRALRPGSRVVIVGDVDQLPSVGPGMVLRDLIDCGRFPVVRLTEIFRQAKESRIVSAAYAIHEGRCPESGSPEETSDFYLMRAESPEAIEDRLVRAVEDRIPSRFGFDPKTEIQVLTPMNRTPLGARRLNAVLQERLNPRRDRPSVERFGVEYRLGDRVIQTENNYSREVFNGDMGVVHGIDEEEQEMTVAFEDRVVAYDFHDLDELSLAYALTIHKSQGSEYPCVVIPLHTQQYVLLQRNLLYTAVTRGRNLVVLIGSERAIRLAVERQDSRHRYTALRRRLSE